MCSSRCVGLFTCKGSYFYTTRVSASKWVGTQPRMLSTLWDASCWRVGGPVQAYAHVHGHGRCTQRAPAKLSVLTSTPVLLLLTVLLFACCHLSRLSPTMPAVALPMSCPQAAAARMDLLPAEAVPVPADKVQRHGWPLNLKQQQRQGAIVSWHYWLPHRYVGAVYTPIRICWQHAHLALQPCTCGSTTRQS